MMERIKYEDCTLTIEDQGSLSIQYVDEVGDRCREKGKLGLDPVAQLTVKRMNEWINFGLRQQEIGKERDIPVKADDLKVIGLTLYRILFDDKNIREKFTEVYNRFDLEYKTQAARGDQNLRFRLKLVFRKAPDNFVQLPWEFLFIPGEDSPEKGFFFAGERTELILTRNVPPSELVKKLGDAAPENLKILVAISRPEGLGGFRDEDVDSVLLQIKSINKAEVKVLRDQQCTPNNLAGELKIFAPHIFHFIGHGEAGKLALIMEPQDRDERSGHTLQRQLVTSEEFQKLFTDCNPRPRLVFLHACKGAADSSQDALSSCARELVCADTPAVVAMQYNISVDDAGLFARTFYEELGRGRDVDQAVKSGREVLGKKAFPWYSHPRFGTPVVYLQTDRPIVVPPYDEREEETDETKSITQSAVPLTRLGSSAASPAVPSSPELTKPVSAVDQKGDRTQFGR